MCGWSGRGGQGASREVVFHKGVACIRVQTKQSACFPKNASESFIVELGECKAVGKAVDTRSGS